MESFRTNIDRDITNDKPICALLKQIGDWAVENMHTQSARILKKVMSKDVIRENYKPLLSQYGDTTRVRTQVDFAGHRVCQCWDEEKRTCLLPEDWLNAEYDARVSIPQLSIMGSSFGVTMEITNLLVHPIRNDCPF